MSVEAVLFRLHDAELSTLSIDRKRRIVTLDFARPDDVNHRHRLAFQGVVGFRVVDLIQQNVVSRILLSGKDAISDDDLYRWVKWANTLVDSAEFIQQTDADDLVERIKARKLSLLVLEPSWGAELVVIFENLVEMTL